jgi:formate hydrogenlyase subunit 3/multisubunit Na+/H+ antiporter MnhD subunit
MHPFLLILLIPAVAGLLSFSFRRLRNELSFIGVMAAFYYAIRLFVRSRNGVIEYEFGRLGSLPLAFRLDAMSGFILLFAVLFAVLVVVFSFRYMRGKEGLRAYYLYLLLALSCSVGVLLAANMVVLLFFWGCLLAVVYGLLLLGGPGSEKVAAKALVVVGLSDFAMLLGVVLLLVHGGWVQVAPIAPMPLRDPVLIAAFLLVAAGALAKAGSMPLHSWIPAAGETAPATVMAYIPASLDKLLGIYLLVRLSVYMFDLSSNGTLRHVLMATGAVTILGAVMMALVQKRMMKLLSFHAVSQVGYMVLGIGTGIPVGIAGGLFHMLNHSIYKAGLFLSAGSVEHWTKTDEIDKLGGLASLMPLTFISFLVTALAISGVPPLNGFASKWMVYQGIIGLAREGNSLFVVYLVAAMLGSVLTMASFLKLLHAVFFGQRPEHLAKVREVGFAMWLPTTLLAALCVVLGLFAYQIPLRGLIYPSLPLIVEPTGIWQPVLTTLLMLAGLGIGLLIYVLGTGTRTTPSRTFVGGERIAEEEEGRVTGTAFYSPVKHLPILGDLLKFGDLGAFDIYNWVLAAGQAIAAVARQLVHEVLDGLATALGRLVRYAGAGLSWLQSGSLPMYVAWVLLGATVFYLVIFLR